MAEDWKVIAGGDLWKVVSRAVVAKADEDSAGGTAAGNNLDSSLDTRASEAVRMAVEEVRAAVGLGRRTPLSETAGSVPPEAERYALYIAAHTLLAYPPSLLQVLVFDGGVMSPLAKLYAEAMKWVEAVRKGAQPVTTPTDPVDGFQSAFRWGDAQGRSTTDDAGGIDLKTDGPWNDTSST